MTVMLRDGYFRPLTKTGTDWHDLLGEEYFAMLMENRPAFSALYASDSSRHLRKQTGKSTSHHSGENSVGLLLQQGICQLL